MAFRYLGNVGGGEPSIGVFTVANDATIVHGQILTMTSSEADEGTAGDATFLGMAIETVDNSADGQIVRAIYNPNAIYGYEDGTAHAGGDTLDLGAGGVILASNSNADFTVITNNTASEITKVIITPGEHWLHK